jgi:iron complex transport system permease protein
VLAIRLPRVLLALLCGTGLSVAGAGLQAVLGNPLAEPYLLGISGGAAFGAALGLMLGLGAAWGGALGLPLLSFVFSMLALLAVYRLARIHGRLPSETVILSGIIVNALFSGLIMLLLSMAGRQFGEMVYILMGNLGILFTPDTVFIFGAGAVAVFAGSVWLWGQSRSLDLLSLGEAQAQSLGVEVGKLKMKVFIASALMVSALVSLSGVIGFVGLMVPHLARMAVGPRNIRLIPAAAVGGGILLVLADTAARTLGPQEIPVGVVTSLLGVPFFVYLLWRKKRSLR